MKPWHFEVAHTLVLNALRNGDRAAAVQWQRQALPPLNPETNHRARRAWVERALKDAQESLDKAHAAALEKERGEEHSTGSNSKNEMWQ
jgi:DNA-directed RNA polymerase specialized sigma24 family protein